MTLLRERERSDDNDARAFLLSNKAEERIEALPVPPPAQLTTRSFAADAFHGACFLNVHKIRVDSDNKR